MTGPEADIIPVFPLAGALLLPGGCLPLNIFEPRYLAMVEDSLGSNTLIGMVQPTATRTECGSPGLHRIGCAGRVDQSRRTGDGRILIDLKGERRFSICSELPPVRGYRRAEVRWLDEADQQARLDRARLLPALKKFLSARGLACQWEKLKCCPDEKLVTILAMVCPFSPAEQQALMESPGCAARGELLTSLIELADVPSGGRPN